MIRTLISVLVVLSVVLAGVPTAMAVEGQVIGRPNLELFVPENRVAPGEEATINLFLVNDGTLVRGGPSTFTERVTTARAVTIEFGDVPGIDIETTRYPIGQVPEGTAGPVPVDVTVPEGVPPGTYRVPVSLTYTYTGLITYDEETPNVAPDYNDRSVIKNLGFEIVVEDQARFRIVDVQSDVQVGDEGALVVSVLNTGTDPAIDASVQLRSANEDLTFGNASTSESFVGVWRPGETKQLTYPVGVVDDAELRDYTVTGVVTYTDRDGIARTSNELRASVRPLAEQTFSLDGVESTLRVGFEGTVTGTVVNEGPAPVTDPVVVFRTQNANFDAAETEYALPDLAPGDSAEFAFDIDISTAADPGSRQLNFEVRYRTEDGDRRTSDTLDARVAVGEEQDPFAVEVSDAAITAGSSSRLTMTVTNTESETLSGISAKLFVDDPISSSDDEAFIDELAPGESREISFEVSTSGDTFAKSYPVSVDFEYDRADGTTQVSDSYRLPVAVNESSGGGLPLGLFVGIGVVVLIGAAVVVVRRRE